jgi:hypothetical protein
MRKVLVLAAVLPLMSGGCVAKMAYDVATLPVRVGAKAVDMATVSEHERDQHYVRQQRKLAERRKEQDREARKRAAKAAKRHRDRGIDDDLS